MFTSCRKSILRQAHLCRASRTPTETFRYSTTRCSSTSRQALNLGNYEKQILQIYPTFLCPIDSADASARRGNCPGTGACTVHSEDVAVHANQEDLQHSR